MKKVLSNAALLSFFLLSVNAAHAAGIVFSFGSNTTTERRAAFLCLVSVVSNRFYSTPTNSKPSCYAGPGAFDAVRQTFSPPRPHWLGCDRAFPSLHYQEGKRKSEMRLERFL